MNRWADPAVILVATDLSDLDRLMPFAIAEGEQTGARIILLHVIGGTEALTADAAGMPYYDPIGAFALASKSLETGCALARQKGLWCDPLVREGNAAQQIVAAARQFHADRIILGTRSRGRISKLLLGSVAEQVLRSVNLPVMTVGPEAHREVVDGTAQPVVLHATTLSEASRPSAALACQVATAMHGRLVLLHVLPHVEEMKRLALPAGLDSAALQQLRALAMELGCASTAAGQKPDIETLVVHGSPAIEILAKSVELHAEMIVLSGTHRSALENLTRDRTVYKVLAHACCPVLTLRESPTREEALHLAKQLQQS